MESRKTIGARALLNEEKRTSSIRSRSFIGFVFLVLFILPQIVTTSLWGNEFEGKGPLFIVEDPAGKGVESLKDLPVELYLRIPPHYLVSVPHSFDRKIEEKGFVIREIGWVEAGRSLFLLNRPDGSTFAGPPSRGKVLYHGDEWYLVEGGNDLVATFGREEFRITLIPGRPLPIEISGGAGRFIPGQSFGEVRLSPDIQQRMASSDTTIAQYIQRLQDFQTRYSYTDSVVASAEWIHDKFIEFGFTDVAYDSFWFDGTWQRNVVATKPGTTNPDKVIVIGGHYDSVTYSGDCNPMTWAPGADDNASGTALAMDMARVLAGTEMEMTLKFVPFAAEEQGLHGSWHFAEEAFDSGMDIQLMVNMDMMGWVPDPFLNVGIDTDTQSRAYAEMMAQIAEDSTTLIPQIGQSGGGSDHYPFMQYGFNHVYVQEGDFNFTHWHQCTDSLGNLDVSYMAQIVDFILPTLILVANAPVTPTGLVATDYGDGDRIRLDWDPNFEPDLWGYHVFSGPAPDAYDRVDTAFVNTFTLSGLTENESLYVAVSAIDDGGYQSPVSEAVGTVPMTRPRAPSGTDATSTADDITLSWDANQEIDLAGYVVHRAERGVGTYAPIDSVPTSQTSYVDQDVQAQVYYLYQVTAYDAVGQESDPSDVLRGRLVTHDSGILVIDATKDGTGGPFSPSDEQVDAYYESALAGFNLTAQWDHADSMAIDRRPVDADLAIYSTVVLHFEDRFGESIAPDTSCLAKYLANGGNLLIDGWLVLSSLSDGRHDFQPGSFFYDYLKTVSFTTTSSSDIDFVGVNGIAGNYPDVSIDEGKVATGALFNLDIFDVEPVAGEGIYTYIASDSTGSPYHEEVVGGQYIGGDYGLIVMNFPLFYMNSSETAALMYNAMTTLGEQSSIVEGDGPGEIGLPRVFSLGQNYPNPFNPSTTIQFAIPTGSKAVPTQVKIYDLRGRLIRTILDEPKEPGYYQVHWDGRNDRGGVVASGVYLYTIAAGDFHSARKMVVVR